VDAAVSFDRHVVRRRCRCIGIQEHSDRGEDVGLAGARLADERGYSAGAESDVEQRPESADANLREPERRHRSIVSEHRPHLRAVV